MISKIEDCPSFSQCEAPLCPLYEHLSEVVWYSDEPICTSLLHRQPWIRTQRRIAKRTNKNPDAGYFTVEMLKSIKAVSPQTKGINPDHRASQEKWIGKRKARAKATIAL